MAALHPLNANDLPASFSLDLHGERPIIALSVEGTTVHISYKFPGFSFADLSPSHVTAGTLSESAFHHEVGISGTGFLSESGKPLMPSLGRFLQIPPNYDYRTRVRTGGVRKRKNFKIRPAQENARDQEAWIYEFDAKTYIEDKFFPDKAVEISRPFYMDGYRVLCIHVRPLQYNPLKRLLRGYSQVDVSFDFFMAPDGGEGDPHGGEVPSWVYMDRTRNLDGFGNLLLNPERKYFEKAGFQVAARVQTATPAATPELLIIHGAQFGAPARKLQSWKRKCGLDTALVPAAGIFSSDGTARTSGENVQRLKTYIRGLRQAVGSRLQYVLLFGDIDTIPTEERPRPVPPDRSCDTTDYYYYTHRDAVGEECVLPWLSGGRIAAADENEGTSIVDQVIRYEKDPPDDPTYFNRMTVAAYFEDCDTAGQQDGRANQAYMKTMETIREHMMAHGFEVNRVYVTNNRRPERYSDGTLIPPKVREACIYKAEGGIATKRLIGLINEGQLIIGHRGHGDYRGWLNPPLNTEDLAQVASATPSVFFSINCRTGSFDNRRVCFAERLLATIGGAPSLIAATELSGTWRNDSMIKALFDAIWPGVIQTYPVTTLRLPVKSYRIGDILNYAKAYLLISHGMNANTQKHLEIYHVLGDPTLRIWGSEPMSLRLRARIRENILVVNTNTCPLGAVLTVWFEDECLWKLEPSGTRLAIPLLLFDKLPKDAMDGKREHAYKLSVYFSAPNHRLAATHLWF